MPADFSAKLSLILKAFSISRARLAADLGLDKSVVGRWVTGAVAPAAHNLSLLTAYVTQRVPGFTNLDWDRSLAGLAERLGADPSALTGWAASESSTGLPWRSWIRSMRQVLCAGPHMRGSSVQPVPMYCNPVGFCTITV